MITWLRFAYVSVAIWYFSIACKFGSIHGQLLKTRSTLYTIIYFTLGISFFFFLSTLNSTCHLCPRHQISEMLLQRWRSPCNQRFCPKTGEASCPMNGTMKSSSSWIEKISTVVRSHELTSLKVIICAISRWSTHISCHRHIFFPLLPPFLLFISLSRSHVHTRSISPLPTRFQSSDRYTGYIPIVFPDQTFFCARSVWL